jgi:hypothetical protein
MSIANGSVSCGEPDPPQWRNVQAAVTVRCDRTTLFYNLYVKPMDLCGVRRRRLLLHATGNTLHRRAFLGLVLTPITQYYDNL